MSRRIPAASSWAEDLRHPLSLGAIALLALNDHVLKGAGLLPGWLTGKLSDVAGMFFFPILLVAGARRFGLGGRRVAIGASLATAVVFALLKTSAPFNAWVERAWGVNVMDPTDLVALPLCAASALFMLRARTPRARAVDAPTVCTRGRRALDFAIAALAGIASMATSAPPPPTRFAVAPTDPCASLVATVCEASAESTLVVVEARSTLSPSCEIHVLRAHELTSGWNADQLPAPVTVTPEQPRTFALAFLRPASDAEQSQRISVELEVARSSDGAPERVTTEMVSRACAAR